MSLIDLFVFLLFDGAYKECYSYYIRVTEMFPQISLSIANPKKNVYHVCKQRKRFFYFVTHLCVFTSGLRMRKEKENHIYLLSIPFQSLIFPNKDPSKPYLPTRCYSLSLQKYTEHYFKAEKIQKGKFINPFTKF